MVIGKDELISRLLERQGDELASKAQASRIVNNILDIISDALLENDKVRLSEVGTLETVDRSPRKGTCVGKEYDVPASKGVSFTASKILKEKLNAK